MIGSLLSIVSSKRIECAGWLRDPMTVFTSTTGSLAHVVAALYERRQAIVQREILEIRHGQSRHEFVDRRLADSRDVGFDSPSRRQVLVAPTVVHWLAVAANWASTRHVCAHHVSIMGTSCIHHGHMYPPWAHHVSTRGTPRAHHGHTMRPPQLSPHDAAMGGRTAACCVTGLTRTSSLAKDRRAGSLATQVQSGTARLAP